ncbi:hypothetical protein BKH43_03820 [Helicobacter sp. 13S00401-1]|uniref:hypothetical protein n=1 Tax=Helicobacter sp. 13S00401-1 TaxID=1905758 RepID=UPI000BA5A1DA|nr:hypothetical protein [Helicobacter sp. 13S00401-1]PAF50992.1 hypothetical protein BKH43_03820 [Helicobacter sp. 13S00401-1]
MTRYLKKGLLLGAVGLSTLGFLGAKEGPLITMKNEGHLAAFLNTNFNPTFLGLNAQLRTVFGIGDHWHVGIGAIGGWSIIPYSSVLGSGGQYLDRGDVSDAYVQYTANGLNIAAGRYYLNKVGLKATDFINGPIQGVSVNYNTRYMNYYFHYINSFLNTGYLPGRIGSNLSYIGGYNPTTKQTLVGGEIFNFGVDFARTWNKLTFYISPWVLFNTSNPYSSVSGYFKPIAQVGAKVKFGVQFTPIFDSSIIFNGGFQYSNFTDTTLADNFAGLLTLESFNTYKSGAWKYNFGLGIFSVVGSPVGGNRFYTISDNTRFYGRYLNGGIGAASYFAGGSVIGYAFGGLDYKRLSLDLVAGGGTYNEVSAVGAYKVYVRYVNKKEYLGFQVGLGYSFVNQQGASSNALMAFGKLYY